MDNNFSNEELNVLCGGSDELKNAIERGVGARSVDGNSYNVGSSYKIVSVQPAMNYFKPKDSKMSDADWNNLPVDKKIEKGGRKQEWLTFVTTRGNVSVGAVMGRAEQWEEGFWDADKDSVTADTLKEAFHATASVPAVWVKSGCDGLVRVEDGAIIGKTLLCLAKKKKADAFGNERNYALWKVQD